MVYDSNIGRLSYGKQSFSVLEMSTFTRLFALC